MYVMLYQLLGYVVIFVSRPYYTCLCWFCYIDLTQFKFLTADMNYISYTIWRYVQNPPTYQISYVYTNSVSTIHYDSRISFSLILHHMKEQGRLLMATVVTDNMWKLSVKYLLYRAFFAAWLKSTGQTLCLMLHQHCIMCRMLGRFNSRWWEQIQQWPLYKV